MPRLPQPGSDQGTWGDILNAFLQVAHNPDGSLQPISNASITDGTITSSKLVNGTITGTKIANNTITDANVASANIDGDAATPSLRTLGTGPNQAMPGDASVAPSAHAATHKGDGADPINNATTTVSGLMAASDKTKLNLVSSAELGYVSGVTSSIQGQIDGKQPADGDLTDISVLTPSNDDVLQRKLGEWTNRTPAQLKLDLGLTSTDVGLGNVTNDAQLKIASNLSDVANAVTAFGNIKQAATDLATGVVELATIGETSTGTDANRVVTPDGLAGSIFGTENVSLEVVPAGTTLTTGDGKMYFRVPSTLSGMDLVAASAAVTTTSSSGTPTIQIARGRQANATSAHAYADMLSTRITIDVSEYDSKDATTAAVIDAANDDVATGDLIRIDIDVTGTSTAGLYVTLQFRLP